MVYTATSPRKPVKPPETVLTRFRQLDEIAKRYGVYLQLVNWDCEEKTMTVFGNALHKLSLDNKNKDPDWNLVSSLINKQRKIPISPKEHQA